VKHAIFDLAALAVLLAGLARFEVRGERMAAPLRIGWAAGFSALAVFQAWNLLRIIRDNLAHPPLWDFKVFWMVGRVAVAGGDVYDPASYAKFDAALNPGHDPVFSAVAVGVGLPYPPPALFLFYPLGWFDLQTAMRLWYVAMLAALALASVLLWRHFFASAGAAGWLAAALLLLLLPQTGSTFALAQVNVFALVLLIAYWRERVAWRAGCWLAPLGMLRPPALALALEGLAPGRRALFGAAAATAAALFLIAFPLAGPHAMTTYVRANPSGHYPESFFAGYQSLYQLLALHDASRAGYFSLTAHPAYVASALALLAAAAWLVLRVAPDRANMSRAALLALGLFIYPSTGAHYALLLVVPLCEVWRSRTALGLGTVGAIAAIEINYALLRVGDGSQTVGLLLILDAVFFAALALRAPSASLPTPMAARLARSSGS
jgi:hypothetical protein